MECDPPPDPCQGNRRYDTASDMGATQQVGSVAEADGVRDEGHVETVKRAESKTRCCRDLTHSRVERRRATGLLWHTCGHLHHVQAPLSLQLSGLVLCAGISSALGCRAQMWARYLSV